MVIVVVVCRRRRNKTTEERSAKNDNGAGAIELHQDGNFYDTVPETENTGSAELDNDDTHYSIIPADVYSSTGPVQPDEHNEYTALETSHYLAILPDDEC